VNKAYKKAVIEQMFMDRKLMSGIQIKDLPRDTVDAMLDIVGDFLFEEDWEMNNNG